MQGGGAYLLADALSNGRRPSPLERIMSKLDKLKPCPFCGGEAKVLYVSHMGRSEWRVYCYDTVGCVFNPRTPWYRSRYYAVRKWNRRAP